MKKYLYLIVLLLCVSSILQAQTLPDQFDIQFSVQRSSMEEPGYNHLSFNVDPLMAAMVSKQLKAELKEKIKQEETKQLRLQDFTKWIIFNPDSLDRLLTQELENVYFDEDTFEEEFRIDTFHVSINDLFVNLQFSIGYDSKKDKLYGSLVAVQFSMFHEDSQSYMPVIKRYYTQSIPELTFENMDYINRYLDEDFGDQDYNFEINVPLYEKSGWATTQKQITHFTFSEAYFEQHPLPQVAYDYDQNEVKVDSTLVIKEIVEYEDEYGDWLLEEITETIYLSDVVVLFNLKCNLSKVMHVEEIRTIGYGTLQNPWEGLNQYTYHWFNKK